MHRKLKYYYANRDVINENEKNKLEEMQLLKML